MKKRGKKRWNAKAVSPLVSTVLLIIIVIILAIIIFLWAKSWIGEIVEKEIGGVRKDIEKWCTDVNFEAEILSDAGVESLVLVNKGTIPIYEINVKRISAGTTTVQNRTINLYAASTSERIPLVDVGLSGVNLATEQVVIVPVLLGEGDKKTKKYTCNEKIAGYELEQ